MPLPGGFAGSSQQPARSHLSGRCDRLCVDEGARARGKGRGSRDARWGWLIRRFRGWWSARRGVKSPSFRGFDCGFGVGADRAGAGNSRRKQAQSSVKKTPGEKHPNRSGRVSSDPTETRSPASTKRPETLNCVTRPPASANAQMSNAPNAFAIRHSPFAIRHSSFVIRHSCIPAFRHSA